MHNQHLIDTAIIDISCDCSQAELDRGLATGLFAKDRLMRVVDEVFDRASRPGTVIRITRLEIDLGAIPYESYQEQMPQKLREHLDALLADMLHRDRYDDTSHNIAIDKHSADAGELYHFLLYGSLPWYSRTTDMSWLETLLEHTLDSSPAAFSAFLSQAAHRQTVTGRLVNQFSIRSISRVYRLMAPVHYRVMQDYMSRLEMLVMSNSELALPSGSGPGRLIRRLWRNLIMEALRDNSSQTSAPDLFKQALKEVCNQFELDFSTLIRVLGLSMQSPRDLNLMTAAPSRYRHDRPAAQPGPLVGKDLSSTVHECESLSAHAVSEKLDLDRLSEQLVSAMFSGDASLIRPCWSVLMTDQARLFERTLRHHGQQSKVRRQIAWNFPEDMLLDLLTLLVPADYAFIKGAIESGLFYAAHSDELSGQARRKAEMWEISLGYLLVECTGGCNRQAYLCSVIKQRAMAARQRSSVLLSVLNERIAGLADSGRHSSPLVKYLLDPSGKDRFEDIERLEGREQRVLGWYRAYQCLKDVLTDVNSGSSDTGLVENVLTLRHQAPWLLTRLYWELRAGAYTDGTVIERYGVRLLRELVDTFLELSAGPRSELHDAVERYADGHRNLQGYYLQVLQRLLKGELIDFDSIETEPDPGRKQQAPSERPQVDGRLSGLSEQGSTESATADSAVIEFLCSDKALTDGEIESLASPLEQIPGRRLSALRQQLESRLSNQNLIQRLARYLPEWMQIKLLGLMGVSVPVEILQDADTLVTTCLVEGVVNRPEHLQTLKWTFIYRYIAESGRLFNRDHFARRFVESLLEQTDLTDIGQLSSVLKDGLRRNMPPSSRSTIQRLTESLSHDTGSLVRMEPAGGLAEGAGAPTRGDDLPVEREIYIANAGLVLVAPYLPRLFELAGLVRESAFKDRQAAERGVHMLQFLVNEAVSSPEYLLALNKLLCGIKPGRSICRDIVLSAEERQLLESMLLGLMQNWKPLANTSIKGFRESFLQRNGILRLKSDAWHLSVEARSYDMLLDQVPWSFSMIRFPWMHRVIHVEWR